MQPHQVSYLWSQIHISPTDHRLFSWPTFAITWWGCEQPTRRVSDEQCMDSHVASSKQQLIIQFVRFCWGTVVYLEPRKWSYEGRGDGLCKPHVLHDMDATGSNVIAPPPHAPPKPPKMHFVLRFSTSPTPFRNGMEVPQFIAVPR